MTVLAAIQNACPRIGLAVPSSVFASVDRDAVELARIANVAADEVARAHAWQELKREHTITGDGSTEDWPLPDGYHWIPNGNQLWSSAFSQPLDQVPDENTWLGLEIQGSGLMPNAWIIYGDEIHIREALESGVTARFFFQHDEYVLDAADDPKDAFTADDDTFVLDEGLLTKFIIYLWKADKGVAYAQHLDEAAAMLEQKIGRNKGPRRIAVGRARYPSGVKRAWPGTLG